MRKLGPWGRNLPSFLDHVPLDFTLQAEILDIVANCDSSDWWPGCRSRAWTALSANRGEGVRIPRTPVKAGPPPGQVQTGAHEVTDALLRGGLTLS